MSEASLWDREMARTGLSFDAKWMDDDPRFALWAARKADNNDAIVLCSRHGERKDDKRAAAAKEGADDDAVPWMAGQQSRQASSSRTSVSSSSEAGASTRSGKSGHKSTTSDVSQLAMLFPSGGPFLIAASMPAIVAELTSHIDNRFMTDFFYTYRAYVPSHELLRLLITRFHWTLDATRLEKGVDDAQRNIIRVRTYVVIKYWLTNFFTMDFLPNRALRLQLTDWLNNYSHTASTSDKLQAGLGIIRSLRKIVRNLKAAYEQTGISGLLMSDEAKTPRMLSESTSHPDGLDEAGQEACVSLDLGDDVHDTSSSGSPSQTRSPVDSRGKANTTSPSGAARWPSSQTPLTIGPQHAPPPLPTSQTSQGVISRAFLNTFSRLSRLKRHINARSSINPFLNDGIDGSDFDTNNCGDLLFIRGGLESFLDYFELREPQYSSAHGKERWSQSEATDDSQDHAASDGATIQEEETPSLSSNQTRSTPASSFDLGHGSPVNLDTGGTFGLGISREDADDEVGLALSHDESQLASGSLMARKDSPDLLHHFQSDQTLRSASRGQKQPSNLAHIEQSPSRFGSRDGGNANNVVLIDDIDLSSDEDDGVVRRALRRLPAARDLRTVRAAGKIDEPVRQSFDSVSSFGQVHDQSRRSLASYFGHDRQDDALAIQAHITSVVTSEMLDPDEALRGFELVKGFRLNDLGDSDDDEPGDVEAALRRLEGVLDVDKERERARKVENMWQRSQARNTDAQQIERQGSASSLSLEERPQTLRLQDASGAGISTVPASSSNATIIVHDGRSNHTADADAAKKEARTNTGGKVHLPRSVWAPPPVHRSFLLDYRADVIAQQFSLIESELFRAVAWQELVSGQWKVKQHTGPLCEWETFYQTRARNRVQAQRQGGAAAAADLSMESSVEAITARFKLMCNWVASEIVLTNSPEARAAVIRKLIRVAWRSYHYSNFATLTQIILGLQIPSVERLTKTWAKVGTLEMRMLRDLEAFINPAHNFKHLRNAMRDMMIQGHMEDLIISSGPPQATSKGSGGGGGGGMSSASSSRSSIISNDGCIPFFGLFLADLAVHDALPTFVDPSSPDAEVEADTTTGSTLEPAEPKAFEHLPALPEGVALTPLVNLYKFRILAMTVKSILALQERLEAFNFPIVRSVYVKSLKLRTLNSTQLTIISQMAEE